MTSQRLNALEPVMRTSYTKLYASADGETHFQDVPVLMAPVVYIPNMPNQPLVDVAPAQAVTALTFSRLEAGFFGDWHPAPRCQFVVVLSGGIELTVSDGDKRVFGPGGVYLVEDTRGRARQTRATGTDECLAVTITC